MNTHAPVCSQSPAGASRWPARILVLALGGILFLTLYPFRFARPVGHLTTPLLLGHSDKPPGSRGAFLNVLLFVPYGFGLAAKIGTRRKAFVVVAIALATGALLSYLIEILQLYIPERDSGWDDVVTNSIGALIGAVFFQILGVAMLRFLRNVETRVETFATRRNAAIAVLLYFAVWFAASAHLQRAARLSNWDGKPIYTGYHLGPGPALARLVREIRPSELEGYRYIFYSLVFFPAGSFLAVGWREHPERIMTHLANALASFALAPVLLEMLLIQIGGNSISLENIGLGFAAMCLGAIWINLGAARVMSLQAVHVR